MAIRGGKVKSVKALKASMKRGGGASALKRIPEEPLLVRFLTEPDEWFEIFEHWDDVKKHVLCVDDCDYCADDVRVTKRALAPVVLIDDGTVAPLVLPSTLVSRLLNKYDKYSTMLDRDYEIIRTGKGMDTEYDVTPESPTRMKLSRFEVPDLQEILDGMSEDEEDDDEEDERPAKRKTTTKRRPVEKEDEDEDSDDEDDDDEDEEFLRPRRGRSSAKPKSRPTTSSSRSASSVGKAARPKPRPRGLSK